MYRIRWDYALSNCLQQHYSRLGFLLKIKKVEHCPRKIITILASLDRQHHISHASTTAYAAVVYIRQIMVNSFQTKLLRAQTRFAPVRSLCISRLNQKCLVRLDGFNGNNCLAVLATSILALHSFCRMNGRSTVESIQVNMSRSKRKKILMVVRTRRFLLAKLNHHNSTSNQLIETTHHHHDV